MKKLNILIGTLILSAGLAGCSSSYYASSGYANDDLYALHDKTAIARKQQAAAEARKAEAEARRAEWEAKIAEAQALAAVITTSRVRTLTTIFWPIRTRVPMRAV